MPEFKDEVREHLAKLGLEPTREAAIVEEVGQHMEQRYQDMLARGVPEQQARRAVSAELADGELLEKGLRQVEDQIRAEDPAVAGQGYFHLLSNFSRDLRYAARALRHNVAFSLVAIVSLALGIGANTGIFQLLDAVRLRTLPVAKPSELVDIGTPNAKGRTGESRGRRLVFTNAIWEQIRDHEQPAFSGLFAYGDTTFNLTTGGQIRMARGMYVSGKFFQVLGVAPLLGRTLAEADDRHGCGSPPAVISYSFWQRELGGRADAVGSTLKLEGHPVEIVGVTPPAFFGLEVGRSYDVAVPLCSEPLFAGENSVFSRLDGWWLGVMGRLKPGATVTQASAQLESISPGIFQATVPPSYQPDLVKKYLKWKLGAVPAANGISSLRSQYEQPLWLLLAIAGTVLLIACANLANLMFARASARERELAVRLALGASRQRLMQQLMMESLLLAGIGAGAGIALAQVLSRGLVSFFHTQYSNVLLNLNLDWRVLGFTLLIAVLTCLFFGLMPAWRATSISPGAALKSGGRGVVSARERFSVRRVLVVAQVALSLTLLVGALLFVRTFQNLVHLDAGFQQDGLLVTYVSAGNTNIPKANRIAFQQAMLERIKALPGVELAAESNIIPLSGNGWNENVHTNASGQEQRVVVNFNRVSPGFFQTLGTPLLKGRDISKSDTRNTPWVAVVNESFVHKLLEGTDPLGKTFRFEVAPGKPEPMYEIVGVVKDTKYLDLREDLSPIAYVALAQDEDPDTDVAITIRSTMDMGELISTVDRTLTQTHPLISTMFYEMKTQVRDTLVRERLMATLSGFFGLLAGVLATIGLYGVISYMVVRRKNEIGIRMALGANRLRVLTLVLREATVLLCIGLGIGLILSVITARAAGSLLFGLKPSDPLTLVMAAASLALVAVAASLLPAQRAARLDPLEALRDE